MNRRDCLRLIFFASAGAPLWRAQAADLPALNAPGAAAFAKDMAERHGFKLKEVEQMLSSVHINPRVVELMDAPRDPAKKVYWREYRARRLRPRDIAAGAQFLRRHMPDLVRAEAEFGAPPEIITAILGVETRYGKVLGGFRVAEALATLAFGYPRRAAEFRKQLESFMLFARENQLDVLSLKGSYAGAFGAPQFLPESARRHAVDHDGNGSADLFSLADAIGSVGNFLRAHGWRRGGPIAYPAKVSGDAAAVMRATREADYKPTMTREDLENAGVKIIAQSPPEGELYLLADLENRLDTEYRAAAANFYALTRYNNSFKYAATVQDLAAEIRKRA